MKILIILTRFNKFGFVYEKDSTERRTNYFMPLGLAYISSVLKQAGKDVDILNLNHIRGHVRTIIDSQLKSHKYDVVFLGGLSIYYPHIKDIISYIRESSSETKIIVGGGLITAQPEIMIELLKPDFGIIGEGEETALELVNYLETPDNLPYNINGIKGIIFKAWRMPINKEIICINEPRKQIENLNDLPFPDYDGFGFPEYLNHVSPEDYVAYDVVDNPRPYPLLASKLCPYNCTFCFHPLGQKYRQRSIDNVMKEIEMAVKKYNVNIIFLYDELFSSDKERVFEFCEKFKRLSDSLPYKIWFYTTMRADTTDNEMIKKMKESGAYLLSFGLESYNTDVLKSMKKHTTPEQILQILKILKENKVGIQGGFIFGDKSETVKTARETLNFFKENQNLTRGGVSIGFIIPFQGSPIYKHCVSNGIIEDEIKFIEKRATDGYTFDNPMNLTDFLTDAEFEKLKSEILTVGLTTLKYSIPYKKENALYAKCPFCGEVSIIKNINYPSRFEMKNIGCRHCFGRFYIVSRWYLLMKTLIAIFGYERMKSLKTFFGV